MNTALKLTKSTPKQIIDEIQAIDKQILINAIATDPIHLEKLFDLYQRQLQHSDSKIVENAKLQLKSLQDIMDFKVVLTQIAFGLYSDEDVVDGIQTQMEVGKDNVIQMVPKVSARKDDTKKEEVKYFQGYMRARVLDSHVTMSAEVLKLIPLADTMEKINEVAKMLIDNNQEEQALNLSIDLAEKFGLTKLGFPREVIEKKFIFEILPNAKGVKLNNDIIFSKKPEHKLENIILSKWIEYLNTTALLIKSKADIIKAAVKEVKKDKQISRYTQSVLDKFNSTMEIKKDILKMIASELKVKQEDLKYEEPEAVEIILEEIKACNFAEFKDKVLEVLKNKKSTDSIKIGWEFLKKNINKVTDYQFKGESEEDRTKQLEIWQGIMKTYTDNLGTKKLIQEDPKDISLETKKDELIIDKEKIVEEAFDKAIELEKKEKEMSQVEIIVRREAQKIVDSKDPHAINRIQKLIKDHKPELKKLNITLDSNKLFTELSEVKKEDTLNVTEEVKKDDKSSSIPLTEKLDIQKEYPAIWEDACLCKTLGDFTELLKMMITENKELKAISSKFTTTDPGFVACTLSVQYLNKLDECKDWNLDKILEWWKNFKENNKKDIKSPLDSKISDTKESSGISKTKDSIEKKVDIKTEVKKKTNSSEPGEVKSSIKEESTSKSQDISIKKDLQESSTIHSQKNNVQKQPVGTLKEVILTASENVKKDSKSGESKATSVEKTGQHIDLSKEKPVVENPKDVQNVVDKTTVTGFASQIEKKDELGEENSATIQLIKEDSTKTANSELAIQETLDKTDVVSTENVQKKDGNPKSDAADINNKKVELDEFHKKYEIIKEEKETKRLKDLVKDFLLENSYLTFRERVEEIVTQYIPKAKNFTKTPKHEIMNFVSSIVKSYKEFLNNDDAKAFIIEVDTKHKAIKEEKNKKK